MRKKVGSVETGGGRALGGGGNWCWWWWEGGGIIAAAAVVIIIIVAMPDSSVCGGSKGSSGRPGQVFHKRRCACRQTVKSVDFPGLGGGSARLLGDYLT